MDLDTEYASSVAIGPGRETGGRMDALIWIGIILIVLWILGWVVFNTASVLMNVLLVVGIVLLVWWAIRRIT